jgi:LPS-assembly protein
LSLHRRPVHRLLPVAAAVVAAFGLGAAASARAQGTADAASDAPALRLERALGASRATGNPQGMAFVRARSISGDMLDELEMQGDAEVRANGAVLRGDRILYDYAADLLRVRGNARVFRDGALFTGPALDYRLEAQTGSMPNASFTYAPRGASGTAEKLEFLGPELTRMFGAEYTTCTPEDRAWWVRAERMDLDRVDEQGSARNATLYFKDVPIFYSPVFEFPLGERRRSGFITPGFGVNSKVGWEASVPYYFDIAPNRDATIEPRIMSKRGVLLQNQFRYLEPTFRGLVQYNVIGNDRETGGSRDLISTQHQWQGRSGLGAGINYNRVSDDRYFIDFGKDIVEGSTTVLPQDGFVSYAQPYWNTAVRVTKNQTLQDPTAPVVKPYERVPQVTLGASRLDWNGFDLGVGADATRFEHPRLENGTRVIFNPSVAYPVLAPGWFVVPRLQWHSTQYDLDPVLRPGTRQRSRDLPISSLDAGLVFERETTLASRSAVQTLEPRLYYANIPYREQNDLPNFDSALADFNFAQLFSENIFVGGDRIAEANQLTAALVSRIQDAETGVERLRAAIGQRFYFDPQRVALPGGAGVREDRSSDLLLALNGLVTRSWVVDFAMQHSTSQDQVVRATVGVRYQPRPASVLSLAYRYKLNELQQTDFGVQWPITNRWYGVGRLNYSQRDNKWVEVLGGLEYKADCWVARVAAQRFVTSGDNSTTAVFFAIELNGLGSVGTSPVNQLRRNIPGYQLINPPPRQPGRYDVYE